jgi:hypothetical protein
LALKTGVFNVVAVVGVQWELVLFLAQGVEIVLYAEGFWIELKRRWNIGGCFADRVSAPLSGGQLRSDRACRRALFCLGILGVVQNSLAQILFEPREMTSARFSQSLAILWNILIIRGVELHCLLSNLLFEIFVVFHFVYEFIIFLNKMLHFHGFFHLVSNIGIELNNLMKNDFRKIQAT